MSAGLSMLAAFGVPESRSLPFLDDLTGLPNRRFLRLVLETLLGRREPFAVLFLDLDDFKRVNDTSGHDQGDRLLRMLSGLLVRTMRSTDIVARYGGDEFVVIARGGTETGSVGVAGKLTEAISSELYPDWGVSASVGIALYPDHASSASDIMSMADKAMYEAKAAGKSRWRVSPAEGRTLFWHEDVFTGRRSELTRITRVLSDASGNRAALVIGETGSGKTALLATLAEGMEGRRLMTMTCRRELSGIPWAPLVSAVRDLARENPPGEMNPLWRSILGRLMPDVFGSSDLSSTSMDRMAALDAFSALLSGWSPLLVLVDNAQWLDPESAELLAYALRTGVGGGLALCAAMTPFDGTTAPVSMLADLPCAERIELGPMTRLGTMELVRARLGVSDGASELAERVHSFSGGNPLFACEYLRSLLNSGMLMLADGELRVLAPRGAVPDRIRSIVSGKLSTLDRETRGLLQQASVVRGSPFGPELLTELSGRSEGEVLDVLDRGAKLGIVRAGRRDMLSFSFTNEAYREEFYRSAGTSLLTRSHAVMADRLLAEGDHLEAGHHLEMCGRGGRALDVYREGAEAGLRAGLPGAAVSCLERADRLSSELSGSGLDLERLLELKFHLYDAYRCAGNWRRTREIALQYAELEEQAGRLSHKGRRSLLLAADCLRMTGRYTDAFRELRSIRERLGENELVEYNMKCADSLSRLGRADEARACLDTAEELLARTGEGDVDTCSQETELLHQRLILEISIESFDVATDLVGRFFTQGYDEETFPWWFFYDTAETMLLSGRPARATELFRRGIERAMAEAALHGKLALQAELLDALLHCFDLAGTSRLLAEVEDLAGRFVEEGVLDDCALVRARMAMETGDSELAEHLLEEQSRRRPEHPAVLWLGSVLDERMDRPERAREQILECIRIMDGVSMTSLIDLSVITTFEELRLQQGLCDYRSGRDPGWPERMMDAMPDMGDRAAMLASGLVAESLAREGRTVEADRLLAESLSRQAWLEMSLYAYRNLVVRSRWHPPSGRAAGEMLKGAWRGGAGG